MRHSLVAVALFVVLLAGCSSSAPSEVVPPASAPVVTQSAPVSPSVSSVWGGKRPSETQLAAFAAAFRQAYPQYVLGRRDQAIKNAAENTCGDLALGEDQAVILKRMASRFSGGDVVVPESATSGIYRMVLAKACPQLAPEKG